MKSADGRFEYRDAGDEPLPDGTQIDGVHRFAFQCRTGDRWCSVNIKGRGHDLEKRNWTLSGNLDTPTLAPSINCAGCWHGFIENGVFVNTSKQPEAKQ